MGYNVPNFVKNNIGYGPAIVLMGASGATPTVDVGAIDPDGNVSYEMVSNKHKVKQGNPQLTVHKFSTLQEAYVQFNSIEWDFTNLASALGAGTTSSSASEDTMTFGGDPTIDELAMIVRHVMAQPATHTVDVLAWTVMAEDDVTVEFRQEPHSFSYRFEVIRSTTNWAGGSLGITEELFKIRRQKT